MPFQGGTNEQVVTGMYRQLRREGKGDEKFLDVYWYSKCLAESMPGILRFALIWPDFILRSMFRLSLSQLART